MSSVRGAIMEAKLRHGRALTPGMHQSQRIKEGYAPAPSARRSTATAVAVEAERHSKRLEDITPVLVECMSLGMHPSAAAAGLGIARDTLSRWLSNGRRDFELDLQTPYARLYKALAEAQHTAEKDALVNLQAAASEPKNWMATAWFLERRFPERWGKKTKTEISGPNGGPVQHQHAVLMINEDKYKEAMALAEGGALQVNVGEQAHDDADEVLQ